MITDCAVYEGGVRRTDVTELGHAYKAGHDDNAFVWLGLHEPGPEEFDRVAREFNLHELVVEDALKGHQRPKLEIYGDTVLLVLKTARYVDAAEEIEFGELLLITGPQFVISVRHGDASPLDGVRRQLELQPDHLVSGPGLVLHAIVDRVVDDYGPVIAGVDQDLREAERDVFSPTPRRENSAERIYGLKREILEFQRATAPLLDPLGRLARNRYPQIRPDVREYFRDVADHLARVVDEVRDMNALLSSMLDANQAQVSQQQNDDTRKISAWVAILAVPTMIAGIYGMNFERMPELESTWGYPAALSLMLAACVVLWVRFRRAGWL